MALINNASLIRRDILARMIKLVLTDNIIEVDRIPIQIRPKNVDHSRCCIYKDRAVLKYKIMGVLGFDISDETDELKPLRDYFTERLQSNSISNRILSVVDEACSSCDSGNYVVTNMCRGCVGRSCMINCNKNAIDIYKGQAIINKEKCVNCGLCQKACPYHAIIYTPVPCEEACPVNAISKNSEGKEHINESNCIYCGKCIESCPFGAIVEQSDIFHVARSIKLKQNVVALIAPALAGQFKSTLPNIINAIKELGFTEVVEVAEGADITSKKEAEEWLHKIQSGQNLMTTSCCPSYVNLVNKHIPELKPFVSETKTPMIYTAEIAKKEFNDSKIVFFSPCLGKKNEALQSGIIDYVISFEELGAWLVARKIEIRNTEQTPERDIASNDARSYAISGGVTQAVIKCLPAGTSIKPQVINGLNKTEARNLKMIPRKPQDFNFLEVMSCENGCIGGCSTIAKPTFARRQIETELQRNLMNTVV